MSEKELTEKNISLGIEFSKYRIAEKQREKGQPVVYVKIEKLLAPRLSRVSKAKIEVKYG